MIHGPDVFYDTRKRQWVIDSWRNTTSTVYVARDTSPHEPIDEEVAHAHNHHRELLRELIL